MMGAGGDDTKESKECQLIPGGFAGTGPNGSFFETPAWVDKEKPPGMSEEALLYLHVRSWVTRNDFSNRSCGSPWMVG